VALIDQITLSIDLIPRSSWSPEGKGTLRAESLCFQGRDCSSSSPGCSCAAVTPVMQTRRPRRNVEIEVLKVVAAALHQAEPAAAGVRRSAVVGSSGDR